MQIWHFYYIEFIVLVTIGIFFSLHVSHNIVCSPVQAVIENIDEMRKGEGNQELETLRGVEMKAEMV